MFIIRNMLAFTLLASAALTSTAHSAALTRRANTGEATFYGGNVQGGMCSFSTYNLPRGLYGTALSDSNWDNSANCGGCVRVSGPNGNAITAMVSTFSPTVAEKNTSDLSHHDRSWINALAAERTISTFSRMLSKS